MKARNAPWIVTVVVSLTVAAGAAVDTSTPDVAAKSWWAHVQYLASDALEGRETGSHGPISYSNWNHSVACHPCNECRGAATGQ